MLKALDDLAKALKDMPAGKAKTYRPGGPAQAEEVRRRSPGARSQGQVLPARSSELVSRAKPSGFGLLQLILTDDCNYGCRYCLQRRGRARMSPAQARRAVDRFHPGRGSRFEIQFHGGEPLLEFPLLVETVAYAKSMARRADARVGFGLTTNGSLCDGEVLDFLARHRFRLSLSFDGAAQDAQRAAGSETRLAALVDRLVRTPSIRLETNSVFTPEAVATLSSSVLGLVEQGVRSVRFAPSYGRPWPPGKIEAFAREVERLRRGLIRPARLTGRVPVRNFSRSLTPRRRFCPAGQDRMAVDPRGGLWGCALLAALARARGGAADRAILPPGTVGRFRRPEGLPPSGRCRRLRGPARGLEREPARPLRALPGSESLLGLPGLGRAFGRQPGFDPGLCLRPAPDPGARRRPLRGRLEGPCGRDIRDLEPKPDPAPTGSWNSYSQLD